MNYGIISNGTTIGHGVRSEYEIRLGYQVISEDIPNNKRQVKLQLEVRSINSRYYSIGDQDTTIDGVKLSRQSFSTARVNEWQIFGSRIIEISGAFSGTKTASFTTTITTEWALSSGSASVQINLPSLHQPPRINSVSHEEQKTILGSYNKIAQFLSIKRFNFNYSTFDGATINNFQIYYANKLIGSSSSNGVVVDFSNVGQLSPFKINNVDYITLTYKIVDSMNASSTLDVNIPVDLYLKPNLVATSSAIKRNGQLTGKVKLNLVGSFFNNTLAGQQNSIQLDFKYWKKDTTEPSDSEYHPIPYSPTTNNINIYNWNIAINGTEIDNVDKDDAYYFKIKARDYFNETSIITLLCTAGEYVWAEFKDRVDFKNIQMGGLDIFPVGYIFMTTDKNFNPNGKYKGTWERLSSDAYLKIVNDNAGRTGGTSSDHKIPVNSLPSHRHQYYNSWRISAGSGTASTVSGVTDDGFSGSNNYTNYEGGGQPYYPYYYGVYAWHRTN